jgi:hypothetical protein
MYLKILKKYINIYVFRIIRRIKYEKYVGMLTTASSVGPKKPTQQAIFGQWATRSSFGG